LKKPISCLHTSIQTKVEIALQSSTRVQEEEEEEEELAFSLHAQIERCNDNLHKNTSAKPFCE
jgi:hypothetical protein